MKICLIAPKFAKTNNVFLGGATNNVATLSREMAKKHEVHIITSNPPDNSSTEGIEWCYIHKITGKRKQKKDYYESLTLGIEFLIKAVHKVVKLRKQDKIDIINSHSGTPKLGLVSGISGKIGDIPSIHTQYSPIASFSNSAKRRHNKFSSYRFFSNPIYSKFYLSKLDCVISISKNISNSINEVFNKKIEIIPPCLDLSRFNPQKKLSHRARANIRSNLGIENEKIILYIGDRESKGLNVLIDTIAQLQNKINFKVIIAAGHYKNHVANSIKKIKNVVILLGVIDIPSILAVSDIFVAPFLDTIDIADCPISILEAMAMKKPIIASDVGGISEVIEHKKNGLLIQPNDSEILTQSILFLLENRNYGTKIGIEGYNTIKQNFSNEVICKKYLSLYRKLIDNQF